MMDLSNHFISTYSRALLSDWPVIREMMLAESKQMKDAMQTGLETDPILETQINDQQMNDALNGPFHHFFKTHLRAYASIAKVESALTIKKEELFKESEITVSTILGISNDFLEKIELSTVKQLREQCDQLSKQHLADWKAQDQNWKAMLLAEFQKNELKLSDIELQDFLVNQTISELHNRFIDFKITPPKLSKDAFDFTQYFTLKSALTIQSALARMQQPHAEKEIDLQLKKMSGIFKLIGKQEKELLDTQKKVVAELIKPILK
jgi:hypothetical protein